MQNDTNGKQPVAGFDPLKITVSASASAGVDEVATDYKTDYGVARGVSLFVSFIGWLLVVLGAFIVLFAVVDGIGSRNESLSLLAMLPGLGATVSGFLLIMGAQVTLATVDNADHTREILKVLKIKLA